jgi:steroid delta-isomerase-like uncharacterized protein
MPCRVRAAWPGPGNTTDPRYLGWLVCSLTRSVGCDIRRPPEQRSSRRCDVSTENRELSRKFTELFSTGDEALADAVLSPDVVFHGTAGDGEIRGVEAMKAFVSAYRQAFPDARSTVEDQVAEGDKVVTRWRARGTHRGALGPIPPTGREFEFTGITIERIAGARIAEVWVSRDELGLLRQLGLLEEQT